MEGNDYSNLHGKIVTLSFWMKVFYTGSSPVQVPVQFSNNSRSYVTTVAMNATNTWEFKTVTIQLESNGGYSFDNSMGLKISIGTVAGSTYVTANTGVWQGGDFFTTSSTYNFMSSVSNGIRITGVSLVEGDKAPDSTFNRAGSNHAQELMMCQRYYEKSYPINVAPGTISRQGDHYGMTRPDGQIAINISFSTRKRAVPSINFYNPDTTNGFGWGTAADIGESSVNMLQSTGVASSSWVVHYTADAEL